MIEGVLRHCTKLEIQLNYVDTHGQSEVAFAFCYASLVDINPLMLQRVLEEPDWLARMLPEDLRPLSPLIYHHFSPYGTFELDMGKRLPIDTTNAL